MRPVAKAEGNRAMNGQPATTFEIHSEARGPHWVAWITQPGQAGPYQSVLLVGASQEEAEARAREWGATASRQVDRPAPSA
jgi:hypothetical protein